MKDLLVVFNVLVNPAPPFLNVRWKNELVRTACWEVKNPNKHIFK